MASNTLVASRGEHVEVIVALDGLIYARDLEHNMKGLPSGLGTPYGFSKIQIWNQLIPTTTIKRNPKFDQYPFKKEKKKEKRRLLI